MKPDHDRLQSSNDGCGRGWKPFSVAMLRFPLLIAELIK